MEVDLVVSMVKQTNQMDRNVLVKTVVGDEDAATIAKLRKEVNAEIEKKSDNNHVKNILGNELYGIRKEYQLSVKTIKYLQKNFNYMCRQNGGNVQGIRKGLDAISRHPFNDHSFCDSSWCKHIENHKGRFNRLPYGKPLPNTGGLQAKLKDILAKLKDQAEKLANLESTQINENFNAIDKPAVCRLDLTS